MTRLFLNLLIIVNAKLKIFHSTITVDQEVQKIIVNLLLIVIQF